MAEEESPATEPQEAKRPEIAREEGASDALAEATAETAEIERLSSETHRLTAEIDETRDLLQRKQAEFENFRKRVERERQDYVKYAAGQILVEILPVLDNLERAREAPAAGTEDRIREGIEIIYRQFLDTLQKAGLREVEALGREFDPHLHEAMGHVETTEHQEGKILQVYQKGYFLHDRLLRPALVNVAKSPVGDGGREANSASEENEAEPVESDSSPSNGYMD